MTKPPAFQFYPKDWMTDEKVLLMSLEQEGAFIRLLCHSWLHEGLPPDVTSLARICRVPSSKMARLWSGVKDCFRDDGTGRLVNGRQERDREAQKLFRESRSEAGKKGASAKWDGMAQPSVEHVSGNGSAIVLPMANDGSPYSVLQSASNGLTATDPLPPVEPLSPPAPQSQGPLTYDPLPRSSSLSAVVVEAKPISWSTEACECWIAQYGGTAPGGPIGAALKPLVVKHGWEAVRPAWKRYLAETEAEYVSAARFAQTFGHWSGTAAGPARKQTAGEKSMAAAARFMERHKGDS